MLVHPTFGVMALKKAKTAEYRRSCCEGFHHAQSSIYHKESDYHKESGYYKEDHFCHGKEDRFC